MNSKLKIALVILVVGTILGLAYYFRSQNSYQVVEEEERVQQELSKRSSVNADTEPKKDRIAPKNPMVSNHLKAQTGDDRVLSDEELEELDRYFDQVEKDWDQSIESLFLKELALPQDELKEYKKLREAYEMDRLEAYHEYMLEKYGEKYTYSPSEDMEKFENKVREQYQEVLRKRLGDDAYKKYIEALDQFNEKLRREQDPYKGVMVIDF